MAAYESLNYMNIDSLFTEEELLVRQSVRDFVTAKVEPLMMAANREERFPMELVPQFAELGLLGSTIKGYGCAGLGHVAYGLVMQELERGDSGVRSFCSVQGSLVMYPIYAYGSDKQKKSTCQTGERPAHRLLWIDGT